MPRRESRHHHHVYVVELPDRVWNGASFRKANPGCQLGKPFIYVGMTGLDPDRRLPRAAGDTHGAFAELRSRP